MSVQLEFNLAPCPKGRLLLVNVGDSDRPATQEDIENIIVQITNAKKIMDKHGLATIVTHHSVKMTVIEI